MRTLLSIAVALTWGLWFGGLVTLFLAVTALFRAFGVNRAAAGTGAAGIFHAFERYQLVLAAAGLIAAFAWRVWPPRRPRGAGLKTGLFALMGLAAVAAASSTLFVTPRIDALREAGVRAGAEFGRLHGTSMLLYAAETVLLLVAGLLLPSTVVRDRIP